jgi:hypothetical protein
MYWMPCFRQFVKSPYRTSVLSNLGMYSVWLQGQMSDLIILKKHPEFIEDFVNNPSRIPKLMHQQRVKYWEKQFHAVKEEFKQVFSDMLREDELNDLESVYHIRNAIAHSHISLGRDYMLFRPARGARQEQEIKETFGLTPIEDESDPMMLKLTFYDDDRYLHNFNQLKRLDEVCFERLSNSIGIPHSRIR